MRLVKCSLRSALLPRHTFCQLSSSQHGTDVCATVYLQHVENSELLLLNSSLVLIFCAPLLLDFIITLRWIPSAEHGRTGEIKTLEEWGVGRQEGSNRTPGTSKMARRWFHRFA
ncbi:hypothetical protein DL95DRAFT_413522 [Leptodontidium sp. 2 PMI_412]|nr:hypothetical protein DL95DRAFT_413522 [Leptodontidium sp. 2 PMI_412]